MMKYVITGGAGFIGSNLARSLLDNGHSVKIIDNLSTGAKSNLDGVLEKISFHDISVLDYKNLEKIIQG
ncbi:MAG TPA: NAD-dependent epimerase/dehydratase family protein, partial [Candidatus Nitrosotalea sp.]|nr:NAD-dependent epimerase/dehydratase family protein [Candidatus Nitrosotalea sp.]